MKKRFIVILDSHKPEQAKRFNDEFVRGSFGWWHWISNAWLLIDSKGNWTAAEIRQQTSEFFPGINNFVLELRGDGTDTWAGFGPKSEKRNMFTWLDQNWKKD